MRTLYNEGRVLGLNSYELYVRQMMALNPTAHIMTEREWLASTMTTGNSMILKIAAGTTAGYHDYVFPEGSDLCGACPVYASLFEGDVLTDETGWATRLARNGKLLKNEMSASPETPGQPGNIPAYPNPGVIDPIFANQCRNYIKVTSGLVFQPGEWYIKLTQLLNESGIVLQTEDGEDLLASDTLRTWLKYLNPHPDRTGFIPPDYDTQGMTLEELHALIDSLAQQTWAMRGFVRLGFSEDITSDFYILFTGFQLKGVISGASGFDPTVEEHPENGDFLGPQRFPSGAQVVLCTTTSVTNVLYHDLLSMIPSQG